MNWHVRIDGDSKWSVPHLKIKYSVYNVILPSGEMLEGANLKC